MKHRAPKLDRRSALRALAVGGIAPWAPALVGGCCRYPMPITTVPDWAHVEHPADEVELVRLVNEARNAGVQLRVRGSMHSTARAIFTDQSDRNVNVQLDRMNRILAWDDAKKQVTVEAGIHLGEDPRDPAATWANSLNQQLHDRGWALADLGGITHQTVGGFLSTGSAGGSVVHDVGASVVKLRVVAGDGTVQEFARDPSNPNDATENPFYAAGVSMGLFGVISAVTFQCEDTFDITGEEITADFGAPEAPADSFADGSRSLQSWMECQEYNRVLLWPQRGVERAQFWQARRVATGPDSKLEPYGELPRWQQRIACDFYEQVDTKEPPYDPIAYDKMQKAIRLFVTDDLKRFRDRWYRGIPMDNGIDDALMPTEFTELFVDIERSTEVMRALRDFWKNDFRMDRTGPFATEVYPAKASWFWLSPSYRRNTIRVDVFWFKSGRTDPTRKFYPRYWELLAPFDFRFHWGKHLSPPTSTTGVAYRKKRVGDELWNKWMALRAKYDPKQVFVTDYWRNHLGIARPT